ncbi:MAG: hypothetical protein AAF708_17770 [Deinococcota bacterium]
MVQFKTWTLLKATLPAWQILAQDLRRLLLPHLAEAELLAQLERLKPFLNSAAQALL